MNVIQGSLFEDDYLLRSIGNLAIDPDTALTELVANAWDAGALLVKISIPNERFDQIIIEDNGLGMTSEEFRKRWMTLRYNRIRHQGEEVEFPEKVDNSYRRAFGRNGVGRHGMLCFADQYTVETVKNGIGSRFVVSVSSGAQPFTLIKE